ncbi:MAG TPA: hypothetical protein VHG92_04450 [Afifellaceae bacterium]|nr:hypothetical protein [Afifellaceae bacterium]
MAITASPPSIRLPQRRTRTCLAVDRSAAGWAFGSPDNAFFYFVSDVVVDDSPPMPSGLVSRRSRWQVGFIQNVVTETMILRYDDVAPIPTLSVSTPCLDALPDPATLPWYCGTFNHPQRGRIQAVNSFWYQGSDKPIRFRISMVDWPRFTVYNFYGGGIPTNNSRQIRLVECTRHFRTWIAAREEVSPGHDVRSYHLLHMIDFAVKVTMTVGPTGANPLFEHEYHAANPMPGAQHPDFGVFDSDVQYGSIVRGQFHQGSIGWGPPAPQINPVVIRPLANQWYQAQIQAQNSRVAPQWLSPTSVTRCLP